jgi:leucine dehydrogenase
MKALAAPKAPPSTRADHERLAVVRGERSGAAMAVAIHSTRLGPALGGLRLWHYEREEEAVADAMRLARAMTYKAAAAGLDLGGGKGVVCAPGAEAPTGDLRHAILLDFGDLVESLGGDYITAEDVGIGADDMVVVASRTAHVTGLPESLGGSGDPSPVTAAGVQAAMRGVCAAAFGSRELAGRTVAVVGLGHVGERLARGLAAEGAKLIVSDIAPERRHLAAELGATWLAPDDALIAECDVLAPCAVGGAIHAGNVKALRCRALCGAANNQLADEGLACDLAARGILYAPDFIANAGGLINVYRELHGYTAEHAMELALGIEDTVSRIIEVAAGRGITPLDAARELAEERLALAGR